MAETDDIVRGTLNEQCDRLYGVAQQLRRFDHPQFADDVAAVAAALDDLVGELEARAALGGEDG